MSEPPIPPTNSSTLWLCLALVDCVRFIVPGGRRQEWREEWHAEIWFHWSRLVERGQVRFATRAGLLLRSAGALFHALWLRKRDWRADFMIQDLLYGWRALIRKPAFSVTALLVLTLGIGGNTAIFSVVYSVLLRPLPYRNPDRLVMLFSHNTRQDVAYTSISADDLTDFQKQNDVFDALAGVTPRWAFTLVNGGAAEQIYGMWVSANLFDVLGVYPERGRIFSGDEDQVNGTPVVILSHEMWQRRMGSDPNVLGRSLEINGGPVRIVGVMPPGFRFLEDGEIWMPVGQNPVVQRGRNVRFLNSVGRLKDGKTLEAASVSMRTIAQRLEHQYPDTNTGFTVDLKPLHEQVTGDARPALIVLLGAVGCVLLIACANVANLMLVRATDRRREIAVRTAMGADRGRLIRQMLTESVLLSTIGAAAGLLLAHWAIGYLMSLGPNLPRRGEVRIDMVVLAYTLGLSVLTGILFGLVPALQGTRTSLHDALKDGGRGSSGGVSRLRARNILVVVEIALSAVLLVGAGLLIHSFTRLIHVDPGYRTSGLVLVSASIPANKYSLPEQRLALYYAMEDRLKAIPDVVSVGAVSRLPLSAVMGANNVTSFFMREDKTVPAGERPEIDYRIASTDYFQTMGIPLIRGRKFDRRDSTDVAIVNEVAARKFWPGEDPVGKRVTFSTGPAPPAWVTIVGVAGNVRHLGLETEPRAEIYRPYPNNPLTGPMIAVWTRSDPARAGAVIRAELQSIENGMPLTIWTIDQLVDLSIAQRRFVMLLLGIFASVAMILALVGIYGVMSHAVSQRTREIGLRMALGAGRGRILRRIAGEGLLLTALGLVLGLAAAIALTRAMSGLLFGVTHTDAWTYLAVAAILVFVALLACYLPARRASKVDPLEALRYE